MDIIGVKNPYELIQQAGRRKRRISHKKNKMRSRHRRSFKKTRKYRK